MVDSIKKKSDLSGLNQARLFHTCTRDEILHISQFVRTIKFKKGQTVISEGENGGSVFVVKTGEFRVGLKIRGTERTLGIFLPGSHFGELSFIDKKPRSASIHAVKDSELWVITRSKFEQILKNSPQIKVKIMQALLEDLSAKLRERKFHVDFDLGDMLPITLMEADQNGQILSINKSGMECFGYSEKDFRAGLNLIHLLHSDDRARARMNLKAVIRKKQNVEEYTAIRKNQTAFPVLLHISKIALHRGKPAFRITITDLTEQKQASEALKEQETRYRVIAETATDGIITINDKSRIVSANLAIEKMFGYPPEKLTGKPLTTIMPENLRARHLKSFRNYLKTKQKNISWIAVELTGLKKNGQKFPIEISFGEFFENGKHYFAGFIRDISERKKAEADVTAKKKAEEGLRRLEKAIETMQIGVTITNPDGKIVYTNAAEAKMHGFQVSELIGKDARIFAPRDLWRMPSQKELQKFQQRIRETKNIRKNGTTFDVRMISDVLRDSEGRVSGVVTSCEDISERKEMEGELHRAKKELERRVWERTAAFQESERRFREMLETVQLISLLLDDKGRIIFCNDFLARMLGLNRRDLLGRNWFESFIPEEERHSVRENFFRNTAKGTISAHDENHILTATGEKRLISWDNTILRDPLGKVLGTASIGTDITARKKAEEEKRVLEENLQRAHMLQAMGRLVSGVAHEVRNPLNAIQATTESLQHDLGKNPDQAPLLDIISSQVKRLSELMRDLLELGRPADTRRMQAESMMQLCMEATAIWNQTNVNRSHVVRLQQSSELNKSLFADGARIQQVILNLLENAAQHSPDGSEIKIINWEDENGIHVIVQDHGSGISSDHIANVFEPFFTTRKGGIGLGLSLVKHTVEIHGGQVTIRNANPAPGCIVELYFPALV